MRGYWWSPGRRRAAGRARRRDAGPALAHRRPGQPRPRADRRSALPGRRHAERRGRAVRARPRRARIAGAVRGRVPGRRRLGRPRAVDRRPCPATRRPARCSRVDPATGATTLDPRGHRRGVGRHRAPACPRTGRRRAGDGGRRRRRPPADRRRRAGHAADLQVRAVLDVDGDTVLFRASERAHRDRSDLWTWGPAAGWSPARRRRRAQRPAARRHAAGRRGQTLDDDGRGHHASGAARAAATIAVATPSRPAWTCGSRCSARASATCHRRAAAPGTTGSARCRCCMDPYGGPHAQRVRRPPGRLPRQSQWFADQGFAVVVADGRGTPGPGPGVGARGPRRPRRAGARRPGRRAARGGRRAPPTSTWPGSASAAGPSAGTWPRWPCCAAPTSSTPRWPARR